MSIYTAPSQGHFFEMEHFKYEEDKTKWDTEEIGVNGYSLYPDTILVKQQGASKQGVSFVGDEIEMQIINGVKTPVRAWRIETFADTKFTINDLLFNVSDGKRYQPIKIVVDKTVVNSLGVIFNQELSYMYHTVLELA